MNELTVLLIKDADAWTAQCLERDIAAQGQTVKAAIAEFSSMLAAEFAYASEKGYEPLTNVPAAPQYYWKMFEQAERLEAPTTPPITLTPELTPPFMIPRFREARVL